MNPQNCREIFALLSSYLDVELPADACKAIETHLADCPPCIEFAESLRKTVELCREYRASDVPEPLASEAREQLMNAYKTMLAARGPK